jgi:hypothetical protein
MNKSKIDKLTPKELLTDAPVEDIKKAAEEGSAKAQHVLAEMYAAGVRVRKNKRSALKWMRLAVDQGYEDAIVSLGRMYEDGIGVPQDMNEAKRLWTLAAEQGSAWGNHNIGLTTVLMTLRTLKMRHVQTPLG